MKYKPRVFVVDATTAGTRKQLTTADIQTPWVCLQPLDGNSGSIFVGDNQVSATLGIELKETDFTGTDLLANGLILSPPPPATISLSDIWIDTDNSGDDVMVMYLERIED